MPRRSTASAIAMPCSGRMKATSSTMKTFGSRMLARSAAAAEGAVPGTAACELDRRARIELADEVAMALGEQPPRRPVAFDVRDKEWRRPRAGRGDHARQGL